MAKFSILLLLLTCNNVYAANPPLEGLIVNSIFVHCNIGFVYGYDTLDGWLSFGLFNDNFLRYDYIIVDYQ